MVMREIFVDNFAGGGGASTGIEMAIGRDVDIAINHDKQAIRMHEVNHPNTKHYCESVWDVDPVEVCAGQPVGLVWLSPDCKHFSKAKGGTPVDKNIRGLAWVTLRWAMTVRPRVIMLENVEEFKTWGPLLQMWDSASEKCITKPDTDKQGYYFEAFRMALTTGLPSTHIAFKEACHFLKIDCASKQAKLLNKGLGYDVEFRELKACDYGTPTIRKRLFMVARCDGRKIVWPKATHGDPNSLEVVSGLLKPWRTAAKIIDWSIPCPSIFDTKAEIKARYGINAKRPLAENTLKRIASGIQKFVINNPKPFIVQVNHSGASHHYCKSIEDPISTVTSKHGFGIVMPYLMSYHSETYQGEVRGLNVNEPIHTVDTSNRHALVAAFISKYFTGVEGTKIDKPLPTVTTVDHNAIVVSHIIQMNNNMVGTDLREPINTIVAGPGHLGEVSSFLTTFCGNECDIGQDLNNPLRTITSKDRFGIVTIQGQYYQIVDIGIRMLHPRELARGNGVPDTYTIEYDSNGDGITKTEQVNKIGNMVCPQVPEALVRVNMPECCVECGMYEKYESKVG